MTAYNHAEFHLTHKRAQITDEERRLIDEAIARGKVQTIPTGQSGIEAEEYIWQGDPNNEHSFGALVLKNPMTREEAVAKYKNKIFKANRGPKKRQNQEVAKRRHRVRELALHGMPKKEIAEVLGKPVRTIKNDFGYLQENDLLPKFTGSASGLSVDQIEERRAKVKALLAENVTQREIAARLGFGFGAIQNDIRVMRERGELS